MGMPPAGVLVVPGSPDSLASAIMMILTNPDLSAELIQRGISRVKEYYWSKLVQMLLSHYMEFLGNAPTIQEN